MTLVKSTAGEIGAALPVTTHVYRSRIARRKPMTVTPRIEDHRFGVVLLYNLDSSWTAEENRDAEGIRNDHGQCAHCHGILSSLCRFGATWPDAQAL